MMPQSTNSPGPQAKGVTCAESDLIALLRAGDEAAIAQLVDQWSPFMFRIARSFVDSPQSAEDVVQDAWLGMLSGLAKFEGRSSLRTWTFSILINRARTRGAREARTLPQSPLAARDEPAADDWLAGPAGEPTRTWSSIDVASRRNTAPETVVLSREILLELDRAISTLPPRQRQVVTMRDVCGMSTEEVCAALDISPANQRVLLHRARAVLRDALAEYYRG
jgi:RNA polymerase sigma-70 factor (ECF subfamily)